MDLQRGPRANSSTYDEQVGCRNALEANIFELHSRSEDRAVDEPNDRHSPGLIGKPGV